MKEKKVGVYYYLGTNCLCKNAEGDFSVLYLNKRSIKKNLNSFKLLVSSLKFEFRKTCFTETWLDDANVVNSNNELPRYNNQ